MCFVYVDEFTQLFSVSVLHLEMKHSLAKVVKQVVLIIYEWQIIPLAHVVIFMHAFVQNCVAVNMYVEPPNVHGILSIRLQPIKLFTVCNFALCIFFISTIDFG